MHSDDTCPDGAVRIPLRARDGSIRAYAVVDATDAERLTRWRWHLTSHGYAARCAWIDKRVRSIKLHRDVLGLTFGDGIVVDHIDRDPLNNRRSNLRVVPASANKQNTGSYRGASSSYRGVRWYKPLGKWAAQIKTGGKNVHVGYFNDEVAAAEAARAARLRFMPYAVE